MSNPKIWDRCLDQLQSVLTNHDINTWLEPLHCFHNKNTLQLLAPNRYVLEYVKKNLSPVIEKTILQLDVGVDQVRFDIGSHSIEPTNKESQNRINVTQNYRFSESNKPSSGGSLNEDFTFNHHVEGKSNMIARACALRVGQNPGDVYNPLFIYGGVGLGKTHLMQAAGHTILQKNPRAHILYIHSEIFVNDMVKGLRNNTMNEFKRYYRSLDALLIDDIQFFAKKTQSQEEFFHTFNALLEGQRQIIITSDRIPKAINGVEERLISRFDSGLCVSIDPPEMETRLAILQNKALKQHIDLPEDVANFIAHNIHSNIRELEGALHRVAVNANFTGKAIDINLAREALRDILIFQEKQISIESIQQTVAKYYNIRVSELLSKRRSREIARPRQIAMFLAKEFTKSSLPQIGDHFGGRDHTTVLHAYRKVGELLNIDNKTNEDISNLRRLLGR